MGIKFFVVISDFLRKKKKPNKTKKRGFLILLSIYNTLYFKPVTNSVIKRVLNHCITSKQQQISELAAPATCMFVE